VLEDDTLESAAIANPVRVPLYPRNARESHLHMPAHSGRRAVVVAEKDAAEIEAIRDELPDLADRRGRYGNAIYQGYGQPEVLPIAMMRPRQRARPGRAGLRAAARLRHAIAFRAVADLGRGQQSRAAG
jgi:hypothetical protein